MILDFSYISFSQEESILVFLTSLIKKHDNIEIERKMVVFRGWGENEDEQMKQSTSLNSTLNFQWVITQEFG